VVHAHNPSQLEVEIGGSQFEANPGKKLMRPYLKEQAWCVGMCLIPTRYKEEVGESKSKAYPGQKQKTLFEK
jgi:hypothetical protein